MANYSGGEIIAKMLQKEGVEKVFGIIDGTYFGFYANLGANGIELISPRHETSAAHMAGAYARVTGKIGVCMASNGPGVANILPGLVVEEAEGNRVLVITSARRQGVMYPDRGGTYQCFDQTGVIGKIAKWSQNVPSLERLPEIMRRALRKLYEGRPGVVHVDVPESIMNTAVKFDPIFLDPHQYRNVTPLTPAVEQVEQAARLLIGAELPLIHAGSGIIHAQAYEELEQVASLLQTPVTTSWSGRGVFTETSPLAIPMPYIKLNNLARNEADVVLILGSRVGETDWWGKAPYWRKPNEQTTIQVDIDEEIIGANKPVHLGIVADLKVFLTMLYDKLLEYRAEIRTEQRKAMLDKYNTEKQKMKKELAERLADFSVPMNSAHVAHISREVFPDESILVADGGNTAIWAMFYHDVRSPGTILSTFKFGMLGAGVAQALGAAAAKPDVPVCCIIGDGAMGFHPQEIETAVRNNMRVVYLILSDRQWGMVKINQSFALKPIKTMIKKSLSPEENINADLGEIEFDVLAQSMGAYGERVSDPKELKGAIERGIQSGTCAVIHIDVDSVKHMWAPGLIYFKDMHQEPKGK